MFRFNLFITVEEYNKREEFLERIRYDKEKNPFTKDREALYGDLEMIGYDMKKAIKKFEEENKIKEKNKDKEER